MCHHLIPAGEACLPMPTDSIETHVSDQNWAYAAWVLVLVASLSSLFFSEVVELRPCSMCWYQRICLFPLVLVIGAGIARNDPGLVWYALPLAVIGLGIALYHNGLQLGIIPESLAPCVEGESCSDKQIEWFGFLTIPMMASLNFGLVCGCLIQHHRTATRDPLIVD